jgi:hypothetical protein
MRFKTFSLIKFLKVKRLYSYIWQAKKGEIRRVPVPPNRVTPLKNNWDKILTTIVV